jgi:isopentenyl-diphosphate delta-isomerase
MSDQTNDRKTEHIRAIEADGRVDRQQDYFDRIRLKHRALPQLNLADVDPGCEFLGKRLSFTLLISSMTGGDHDQLRTINRNLAIAAQATGVALAVGSQRVMFTQPQSRDSFELRPYAPDALLMANLGAVQLNYGFGVEQARQAVEAVGADALYLHLNPLQEAVQPEGDTDFSSLDQRIGELAKALECPLLLKEVGAGLSPEDIELGLAQGVRYFDLAGSGGTSWSRIEHHRRHADEARPIGMLFQDWGIPTPQALRLARPYMGRWSHPRR